MKRILIINGANLNLQGKREKDIYGDFSFSRLEERLYEIADNYNADLEIFFSNYEGEIINKIQSAESEFDGLIINPGAYSHYSIAIRDALSYLSIPKIEVHISNVFKREDFRQKMVTGSVCDGVITGFMDNSYELALIYLLSRRESEVLQEFI